MNQNSIKMYDKQGSVLRIETTIHDAHDLSVYRASESDPHGPKEVAAAWQRGGRPSASGADFACGEQTLLRLFREHGLILKHKGTHRYQLTSPGRRILPAFIAARHANTEKLNRLAA
jgi:hypothetical protein